MVERRLTGLTDFTATLAAMKARRQAMVKVRSEYPFRHPIGREAGWSMTDIDNPRGKFSLGTVTLTRQGQLRAISATIIAAAPGAYRSNFTKPSNENTIAWAAYWPSPLYGD
jgi:hypothetical protein